jgi:hypothetical protein
VDLLLSIQRSSGAKISEGPGFSAGLMKKAKLALTIITLTQ